MTRYCTRSKGGKSKIAGVVLMVIGVLVLLLFVPCWVWTSIFAILLISVGFLIWRFG